MHSEYLQEQVRRLENELRQTIEDRARLRVQIQLQEQPGSQREILGPRDSVSGARASDAIAGRADQRPQPAAAHGDAARPMAPRSSSIIRRLQEGIPNFRDNKQATAALLALSKLPC